MRKHSMLCVVAALSALFYLPACGGDTQEIVNTLYPTYTIVSESPGGNSSVSALGNLHLGDIRELGKFRYTNISGTLLALHEVTFSLEGTIQDGELSQFTVVSAHNKVIGETNLASQGFVTIRFNQPYSIGADQSRTIAVKARVNSGVGHWVRVHVLHAYNTVVMDAQGNQILPTNFSDQAASDGYFKVVSGLLGLWRSSDSSARSVLSGATDVVLGRFLIVSSGEDMEVRKLGIKITTVPAVWPLSGEIKILSVDAQNQRRTLISMSAADARLYYEEGTQINLSTFLTLTNNMQQTIEVVGNIYEATPSGTTYIVSVGNLYVHRFSTDDFADHLPTASLDATGSTITIQ